MELRKKTTSRTRGRTATTEGAGKGRSTIVSVDQRRRMISEAAYFIAEKRGFRGGNTVEDWTKAEAQIDDMLSRVDQLVHR